jgi:hypothetical protein
LPSRRLESTSGQSGTRLLRHHPADDLVDDLSERRGGVDDDAVRRSVFFGAMQTPDEVALDLPRPELVVPTLIESPVQRLQVDVQDEDCVEQV